MALDDMNAFTQAPDESEMEYLMRFDKLQVRVHKLLREVDQAGHVIDVHLPSKWWGYVLKKGLCEELARSVVGAIGSLQCDQIRKCIVGMAKPKQDKTAGAYAAIPKNKMRCYRCNKFGHVLSQCKEKENLCYQCGKPGHFAKDCEAMPQRRVSGVQQPNKRRGFNEGLTGGRPRGGLGWHPSGGARFGTSTTSRGRGNGRGRRGGRGRGRGRGPTRGTYRPTNQGRFRAHYTNEDGDYAEEDEDYGEDDYYDEAEDDYYDEGDVDEFEEEGPPQSNQ